MQVVGPEIDAGKTTEVTGDGATWGGAAWEGLPAVRWCDAPHAATVVDNATAIRPDPTRTRSDYPLSSAWRASIGWVGRKLALSARECQGDR